MVLMETLMKETNQVNPAKGGWMTFNFFKNEFTSPVDKPIQACKNKEKQKKCL